MTENKKKLAKAAFMIMVATVLSRFAGFFREIIMADYFGLSPARGAFTVAYRIPSLVRTLIADTAITAAFIPVFTQLLEKGKKEEAFRAASSLLSISVIFLCIITALSMFFMPFVVKITAPGFSPDESLFTMTVNLSLIIFPTVVILGVSGIVTGILNSFQHFAVPATAPVLWNFIIIFFLIFYEKELGIYSAAWGILIATVFQLVIQFFPLRGRGGRLSFVVDFKNKYVAEILKLIFPVTLSLGVINFNAFVDTIFASFLGPDRLAAIDSAFRIFHLPMGVFAVAIGTVLFPVFSSLIAKND
ncbi:MAG: murein biosynthesis integral membrane protein MurJ, partial [Candidatus Schekmanbacteria bacterium RBG_16_38_10]